MTVGIEIAGVGMRFTGDNPHAAPLLQQRFAGFLAPGPLIDPVEVELQLTGDVASTDASGDALALTEHGDTIELRGATTHAEIAADNHSARIAGPLAAFPIDTTVRVLLARALLERGALLVHASAVSTGDRGLVFVGPTGSGKTTVATTLDGTVLADEAVALVPDRDRVVAHGTPYWRGHAASAALTHVIFLTRGREPAWTAMPVSWTAAKLFTAAGPLPASANASALEVATALAQRHATAAEVALASEADILGWLAPRLGAVNG